MRRNAFTLVELLVVMVIIAILAGMVMAALGGAAESAKVQRAQQQIAKIDQLINEKWNSYRYRQVPVEVKSTWQPQDAALRRLEGLRELMKYEMPDRYSDISDTPVRLRAKPSLANAYARKVKSTATDALQYSECLYLLLSEMRDGDRSALNFFMSSEIGDTDDDGMPEILDPWGTPIVYLRWAPGFSRHVNTDPEMTGVVVPPIENAVATMQFPNGTTRPDPFDPLKADPRWWEINGSGQRQARSTPGIRPSELRPLIFSSGPDKQSDIRAEYPHTFSYSQTPNSPNDPYAASNGSAIPSDLNAQPGAGWLWIGTPTDFAGDGLGHGDNITNHDVQIDG